MVQTGSDVLNYTGNVGLGLNESGTTVNYGDSDTRDLNASMFNLAYLNMQKNKVVYEQKLKERDETMSKIGADQINIGTVLPEHMQSMVQFRDKIKDYYFQNVGDLKSDPNKWLHFNNLIADFKQAQTVAQSKYVEANKEIKAAAEEKNPLVRQKILDNVAANKRAPLLDLYNPYQQQIDYDPNGIFMDAPSKIISDGYQGYNRVVESVTDVQKYKELFYRMYTYNQDFRVMEPAGVSGTGKQMTQAAVIDPAVNMDIFAEKWLGQDGLRPEIVIMGKDGKDGDLQMVNRKLEAINKENGWKPGDKDYITPLKVGKGPDNKLHFAEPKPDAVFKIALAAKYSRNKQTEVDLDKAKAATETSKQQSNRALAAQRYSAADLNRAKADKTRTQSAVLKDEAVRVEENWNELQLKSFAGTTEKGTDVTRVNANDISAGTLKYLNIDPLTARGGKERFFNMVPANIVVNGLALTEADAYKEYNKVKNLTKTTADGKKTKMFQNVFDYLNYLQKNGQNVSYEAEIIGLSKPEYFDDGREVPGTGGKITRSNKLTTWQAQARANKNTKLYMTEGDEAPAVEQPTLDDQ